MTYIDENAGQTQLTKAAVVDEKYPAASFESKVIYTDEGAAVSGQAPEQPDQFDPKYPAAYFKPKVIYP
ncbi:MAG: hypothetical protein HOO93_01955 [Methyloglobulus sp.]|nr:hypothetical protein [Methyloglobulus sp.]